MNNNRIREKIMGTMYGVAVGDALGAPLEFMSAESIQRKYGTVRDMLAGGWLNVLPGEVTDDTQMTIAVAKGIVAEPDDPVREIGKQFIDWYRSGPKDIGGTCRMSISSAMSRAECPDKNDWFHAADKTCDLLCGRAGGNGALMRTAYIGVYYDDPEMVRWRADEVCSMTHYDYTASIDCQDYCLAIHDCLTIEDPEECKAHLYEVFADERADGVRDLLQLADESYAPSPTGYGVDSLNAALHCILTTNSFDEAVVKAVNLGGDADTIGAITGGLAGSIYGYSSIPYRYLSTIDIRVAADLTSLSMDAVSNHESNLRSDG